MKKLTLITAIFVLLAVPFATPHLVQAGTSWPSNPLTQGPADTTAETTTDDLKIDDNAYYDIANGEVMEIATNVTSGWDITTGTINHARLHVIYDAAGGYNAGDFIEYGPNGTSYTVTSIQITAAAGETEAYWEFPRSVIDTWPEIENMGIRLVNTDTKKAINIELLQIVVIKDATLESHDDSGRAAPEENTFNDPGKPTVYMKGTGFESALEYKIAYYMDTTGADTKAEADVDTATAGGILEGSLCTITDWYDGEGIETWKAVVFCPSTITAPDTYALATASESYVIDDDFTVDPAIPEFSTVMAAIGVAGLCCGIYFWMRKKFKIRAQRDLG